MKLDKLDYFYGAEAEQFSFLRVPRILFTDEQFKSISSDAKLLYGLMLDRMALSIKNRWVDEKNRAYIIYTIDKMVEDLGCSKPTCIKILKELDNLSGIGLIEKKRRGRGKPDIIYIKNFASKGKNTTEKPKEETPEEIQEEEIEIAKPHESTEVKNFDFKKLKNLTSRSKDSLPLEVKNFYPNQTNKEKDKDIYSINQSNNVYQEIIKENIAYSQKQYLSIEQQGLFEEIYQTICDIVCFPRKSIRVQGEDYPYEVVKSQFLKLDYFHVEYVMDRMNQTTSKIKNIRAYLITALYNAPLTINHYYKQEVAHDMKQNRASPDAYE